MDVVFVFMRPSVLFFEALFVCGAAHVFQFSVFRLSMAFTPLAAPSNLLELFRRSARSSPIYAINDTFRKTALFFLGFVLFGYSM